MGWLNKIFASDPLKELSKAEKLLADEPERALEIAVAVAKEASGDSRAQIQAFVDRARQAVIQRALRRAATSEEEEYFGDAAEWLEAAIAHTTDADQKQELETRRKDLLQRELLLEEDGEFALEMQVVEASVESPGLDPDHYFETVVDMLRDDVAVRYRSQGDTFRQLFAQLHQGSTEGLEEGFTNLLAEASDGTSESVVLLERGRLRLLEGRFAAAREDFESCWDAWGDEPLNLAAGISLPGFWGEACLAQGDLDAIFERFEELAHPSGGRLDMVFPYAHALVAGQRFDDAAPYLRDAMANFPSEQDFPQLYALTLVGLDDPQEAIACLEMAIAPSCASGHCSKPPMHLPSLRMLIALYLQHSDEVERLKKLIRLLQAHTSGRLEAGDHRMMAAYFRKVDREPEAVLSLQRAAEAEARQAQAPASDALKANEPAPALATSDRPII